MVTPQPLKVGALFAGYGGIELALAEHLHVELAWYAEWDKPPASIMAHHHPGVPNLWDVSKVDWAAVEPVDIITGGSPCQDLSTAGKRKGMKAGTRSGLWASMLDAVDIIRPSLVVWENVRGAFSAEAASELEHCPGCMGDGSGQPVLRALGRVLGDLADIGYDARWYGLRAADVGAPHGRFRVFLFATPADAGDERSERVRARLGAAVKAPGPGAGHRASTPAELAALAGVADEDLLPTPAVNDMGDGKTPDWWEEWNNGPTMAHQKHGPSLAIEAQRLLPTPTGSEATGAGRPDGPRDPSLRDVVAHQLPLLPTPTAGDHERGTDAPNRAGGPSLTGALLPTPTCASDAPAQAPGARQARGFGDELQDLPNLLPTPQARDHKGDGQPGTPGHAKKLARHEGVGAAVTNLLPTPQTVDGAGGHHQYPISDRIAGGHQIGLGNIAGTPDIDWGQYGPAIRRWTVLLGRPAPMPTEISGAWRRARAKRLDPNHPKPIGHRGSLARFLTPERQLAPEFPEWMMGLPKGHITDVPGLSRQNKLKAAGNGVQPQQCAAALAAFLEDEGITGPSAPATPAPAGEKLLPTVKATNNENRQSLDRYGPNLGMAAGGLLPTPCAQDPSGATTHKGGNPTLNGAILGIDPKDQARHERLKEERKRNR